MNLGSEYIYDNEKGIFYQEKKFLFKNIKKIIPDYIIYDSLRIKSRIPIINGISLGLYLLKKTQYNVLKNKSDFNQKVHFIINQFNIDEENKFMFLSGKMIDDYNNVYFEIELKEPLNKSLKLNKETWEILFSSAFSGIKTTFRERHKLFTEIYHETKNKDYKYTCDVCKESFNDVDEFFSHILEENHFCRILNEFPYDNEIINIKKILKRNI